MIDEAALTGEPIPVARRAGEPARSGTVNAGETFEIRASATAGESTYAGIVRMVNAAQTAKAPFIRRADRYALLLFPITLIIAGAAWLLSGRPYSGSCGPGCRYTVSFDLGCTSRVHCRSRAGRTGRHFDQGRYAL